MLVVFDLDGTLVDSRRDLADSTNAVLASYGARPLPESDVVMMIGEGARMLVARALAAAGAAADLDDALDRFRDAYADRLLAHTRPYDGVPESVAFAATLARLAVLTNKPSAPTRRLLDAFHLSAYFEWIVGADDAPRKPDPAGLERVMREAGVTRDRVLMVGDSMIDIDTARAAGVTVCVALYGFGRARGELTLRGDELLVETPHDLPVVLARFGDGDHPRRQP